MPGLRAPKHLARADPIKFNFEERLFKIGYANRNMPRNAADIPN